MSCGVGHRCSSELAWLWCRLAATAPIKPLAQEAPCAVGVVLKREKDKKKKMMQIMGFPTVMQWVKNSTAVAGVTAEVWVRSLASLSGLRIWCCHELWCMSQMQLGSRVAVALA